MPKTKGLPRLKRVRRVKGLQALPDLTGKKKRKEKAVAPKVTLPESFAVDDEEAYIARMYGDARLAARIRKLQLQFPHGTIPELVVYDWLRWRNIPFEYQVRLFGGWANLGGQIPDFMLFGIYAGKILQVQGDYWHGNARKAGQDLAAKMKMLGSTYNGQRITSVTWVWESSLKNPATRQQTLDMALAGVELPGA